MSKRDGFEPGVPCWIDTWQPDADAAVAFYTALFGWDAAEAPLDDAQVRHVMLSIDGREVAGIGWRPDGSLARKIGGRSRLRQRTGWLGPACPAPGSPARSLREPATLVPAIDTTV